MHAYATVLAVAATLLAAPSAAMFDSKACNGIGACTAPSGCNYWPNGEPQQAEWSCGDAGTINGQDAAGAELNFEQGLSVGTVVPRSEFPACDIPEQKPGSGATLLKASFKDITVYGWIDYTCTETTVITNGCYSSTPNPSKTYTCKVYKSGQACKHLSTTLVNASACPK